MGFSQCQCNEEAIYTELIRTRGPVDKLAILTCSTYTPCSSTLETYYVACLAVRSFFVPYVDSVHYLDNKTLYL